MHQDAHIHVKWTRVLFARWSWCALGSLFLRLFLSSLMTSAVGSLAHLESQAESLEDLKSFSIKLIWHSQTYPYDRRTAVYLSWICILLDGKTWTEPRYNVVTQDFFVLQEILWKSQLPTQSYFLRRWHTEIGGKWVTQDVLIWWCWGFIPMIQFGKLCE